MLEEVSPCKRTVEQRPIDGVFRSVSVHVEVACSNKIKYTVKPSHE
jgi:hypothetical protein